MFSAVGANADALEHGDQVTGVFIRKGEKTRSEKMSIAHQIESAGGQYQHNLHILEKSANREKS